MEPLSGLNLKTWYHECEKIKEFHLSRATIRALVGGRGSGKTTAIGVETVDHSFHNAGAKVYILRKTQESNSDTTLDTFETQIFPNLGTGYIDTGASLFKKIEGGRIFRLPSQLACRVFADWQLHHPDSSKQDILQWFEAIGNRLCSWVYFAGVPEERYRASRFRGYECSLLVFVEADQLSREDLDLGVACLRWKGVDPATCDERGFIKEAGIILDTNPPSPRHWIKKLEDESKTDHTIRFWHLKTADNAHNLPDGYVQALTRQYKDKPAMFKRMLLGEYAEAFDGEPVLYSFTQMHKAVRLPWPKGAYLIRGWDFGTTQAVTFAAYWMEQGGSVEAGNLYCNEYYWDLYEYFARMSDVDRQCKRVLEITQKIFPFWNDREICAGVKDYCDVAGNAKTDKGSSVEVLRSHGIFPGFRMMGLQESLAVYNRLLQKRDRFGTLCYQIDEECCPMLSTASEGGYRFPIEGEPGFGGDAPLKGPAGGDYDHISDASRYPKFNLLRLIREELEHLNAPVGGLSNRPAANPARRYY